MITISSKTFLFGKFINRWFELNQPCLVSFGSHIIRKNMPRDKINVNALKESKKKTSSKKSRFPPGEIYLCVLGNGSSSSSRALYMFTDHARYLFNCGEGTQRLANEHKMKLSKLENIFITHKSWHNTGGLLGMSLTMQDMGVSEISLHGPSDLDLLFKHSESFVFLNNLKIMTKGFTETFVDDCMEVKQIPIFKTSNSGDLMDENIYASSSSNDSNSDEQSSKRQRLSDQKHSCDVTVAYACKGHSRPGTLLLEKCTEFKVPVGPLLGDLKNGKDVILPSGKTVRSKDVVSPEQVCSTFLVVECPSEEFLEPFVSEKQFEPYQDISRENSLNAAALVVHFTPSNIVKLPRYQEWMKRFPNATCHLILNKDCGTLNSLAVHCMQHQLNLLHPDIFSLLHEKNETVSGLDDDGSILFGRTLDRYYLRPANGFERKHAIKLDPNTFTEDALDVEGFSASLNTLKTAINEYSNHKMDITQDDKYPSIAFLGTGSCIPSKARNVSAILVNTSENEFTLLDCGEGTYSQLLRLYGPLTENILLQMSCIFISHIHADHHLGLIRILERRERLFNKTDKKYQKIALIGPRKIKSWLKDFSRTFQDLTHLYRFIECSSLLHEEVLNTHCKIDIDICNDILISTVPVIHCPDSHAVIISSKAADWKLVYSGDTMPCKKLIAAGKDCSLLIHEATMEDELAEEAAIKKHSTTGQAIQVAEEMKAQYTLLTHFSQRYAKVPLFNEKFHNKIGCAFDNMKVCPSQFHILPLLIPTLSALFKEYVEDIHIKGEKRRQKAELLKSILLKCQAQNCTK